jgi:glycosyltransferase involved in cell wall biosynthesis
MDVNELVSVIIPCFNSGRTLSAAIDSIRKQTYKCIEIIVVNDGSNDAYTIDVLKELLDKNETKILNKTNGGLASARNYGIRNSTGKFIVPLDADDKLSENSIYEMMFLSKKNNSENCFVYPNIEFTGLRNGLSSRIYNPFVQLVMNQLPYSMLFTRHSFDLVGGYDESFTEGLEDWDFNIGLIELGLTPVASKSAHLQYNVDRNGMLLSKTIFKYFDIWSMIKSKHKSLYTFSHLIKSYLVGFTFRLRIKMQIAVLILMLSKILPHNYFNLFLVTWLRMKSTSRSIWSKFKCKINPNFSGK